jgi:hypothetical protein
MILNNFFLKKPLKNLKKDYYKLKKVKIENNDYLWSHHENYILLRIENKGTGG